MNTDRYFMVLIKTGEQNLVSSNTTPYSGQLIFCLYFVNTTERSEITTQKQAARRNLVT